MGSNSMTKDDVKNLKNEDMNFADKIYIFDTTLRDGEQTPGVALTVDEKIQLHKSSITWVLTK